MSTKCNECKKNPAKIFQYGGARIGFCIKCFDKNNHCVICKIKVAGTLRDCSGNSVCNNHRCIIVNDKCDCCE